MIILYIALGYSMVLLTVTVVNALTAPVLKNRPGISLAKSPRVSVLIPARNEERNITRCLDSLQKQTYKNIEILVLDDESTDNTPQRVKEYSSKNPAIRLVPGKPLPANWTGKNWACQQLSELATGEFFLFTDADNFYHPEAIENSIIWMQKYQLDLLSAFPQQITGTLMERLVVPTFDYILYSMLPLWLTLKTSFPSLAAANGQWLIFKTQTYKALGGHAAVKNEIVEDVEFSRLAKLKGFKILTASGRDLIFARMYHNAQQVWQGFSKNAFGLTGHHTPTFLILLTLMFLSQVLPLMTLWFSGLAFISTLILATHMLIRLLMALKFKLPLWSGVFMFPASAFITILIGINSWKGYHSKSIQWKGRVVA
jgi:chlorobactene glucosyltransferase